MSSNSSTSSIISYDISTILIWIGAWGIIDNLIDKYIDSENHNARIMLYAVILILSIIFYYKQLKNNPI